MATKQFLQEAINLLSLINPELSESQLSKFASFGLTISANPADYIDMLREQTKNY